MNIVELVRNPVKELQRNAKVKINEGVLAVIYASIIYAIKLSYDYATNTYYKIGVSDIIKYGIGAFSIIFLALLFVAYLLNVFVDLMDGKGKYKDALLSIGYTFSLLSTGVLLSLILGNIPQIGALLSLLTITLFAISSYGLFLASIHKLYKVDFLVAIVTSVVLVYGGLYFLTRLQAYLAA